MLSKGNGNYYSGTSGLLLPVPNKEFFPESFKNKSRLNYYGSLFNSLEINSSFYKVPMQSTVAKWAADVPDDFRFTFKLWRDITHYKGLVFKPEAISDFMKIINAAGDKKGCLLVQFPGSIKQVYYREVEQMLFYIRQADPDNQWKVAVEFRHQSWYQQDTYDLLEQNGMGLVLHDKLTEGGQLITSSAGFVYLRFHGPSGDYKGSYEDDFLYEYASYIKEWLSDGKQVYTYFNNTMGNALENLVTLRRYIQ